MYVYINQKKNVFNKSVIFWLSDYNSGPVFLGHSDPDPAVTESVRQPAFKKRPASAYSKAVIVERTKYFYLFLFFHVYGCLKHFRSENLK